MQNPQKTERVIDSRRFHQKQARLSKISLALYLQGIPLFSSTSAIFQIPISIKQLIGRLKDEMPKDAVRMLQAVFLSNGKRTDAEMLDQLRPVRAAWER